MPSSDTSSPAPIDHATARSATRCRTTTTATTAVPSQITATADPMTEKRAWSEGVSSLKWLRTPRAAWPPRTTISIVDIATRTQPVTVTTRRPRCTSDAIQASVRA